MYGAFHTLGGCFLDVPNGLAFRGCLYVGVPYFSIITVPFRSLDGVSYTFREIV